MPQRPPDPSPDTTGAATHVMVPWAASLSDGCQQALPVLDDPLAFPHLHALLKRLGTHDWLRGDEYALTTPHERIWAQSLGWPAGESAQLPFAAHWARADGLDVGTLAWGLLTPCHWLMGRDHLTVIHPDELALTEPEARAFFEAIAPLFGDEGWCLHWGAPIRWYVTHESLGGLPTASLDRVLGRNPDLWMPEHPQARLIKRLQAEVQMLLYEHPLNEARQARGAHPVNSFWLSACGRLPDPVGPTHPLQIHDGPRHALLRNDIDAWTQAWHDLDRDVFKQVLDSTAQTPGPRLSLCGERHALTLSPPGRRGWWPAVLARFSHQPVSPASLMAQL